MSLKYILSVLLASLFFLFSANRSFASSNFTTDYIVNYTVNEAGTTHANLSITLTNTTAKVYASSYQMQIGFDEIKNVKASDELGPMNVTIDKNEGVYNLSLALNKKSIGIGTKLPFKLEFDTENIAKNSGNIWEINIPGIANPANFSTFVVNLKVPPSFGKPSIIKPVSEDEFLTFDKDQLGKSGISVAYGNKQSFDFNLVYHLRNTNLYPVRTEIALPPNTNYQEAFIKDMSPKPNNVIIDRDGNWLAQYNLLPMQKQDIKVKGTVELNLKPKSESISANQKKEYTKNTKYWQSNNPKIQKLAKELKTPEKIYEYVVKTLNYNFKQPADLSSRLGALETLESPDSAVCREFTDLFIAIARGAGIPAREVNGYAYTENTSQRPLSLVRDVLHAWPEYYDNDKKTWVMIDPTWGSTTGGVDYFNTLDFDHITFVVKGINDSYPIPAGGYKFEEEKGVKDVQVNFSLAPFKKIQNIGLSGHINEESKIAGMPINYVTRITNNGSAALAKTPLYIDALGLSPQKQALEIPEIPPFGHLDVKNQFDKTSILTDKNVQVKIRYLDKSVTTNTDIKPFFLSVYGIGGVIGGIFAIIIFFIAGKSWSVRIHR